MLGLCTHFTGYEAAHNLSWVGICCGDAAVSGAGAGAGAGVTQGHGSSIVTRCHHQPPASCSSDHNLLFGTLIRKNVRHESMRTVRTVL